MARDYAKNRGKKKKSGASRGKKKSSISTTLLITTILLVSGLIGLLIYLKWFQINPAIPVKDKIISQKALSPKEQAAKNQQDKKGLDDEVPFYKTHKEMLNKTVEIPLEDLKLPEDEHKYVYLMPCGSFRESKRAEELKARIAFLGFESRLNQVKAKSGLWHRVELGPFKSKRKAESIRHRLQDNGFNYCKIWPKKVL